MEKVIEFTFKSGYECAHTPTVSDDDAWWAFIISIVKEMGSSNPGMLAVHRPMGIHLVAEIESVHFGDVEPPEDDPTIKTLGFIK